jgi:uncharacterized protein YcnI
MVIMMGRLYARLGVVLAAGAALVMFGGTPAGAHVSVTSDGGARHGGFAELALRVPNESDTASTVSVQVAFPAEAPIAEVSVLPHPGWTYRVTRSALATPVPDEHGGQLTEAVTMIDWTAAGPDTAIKPGEYEVFRMSAGPLPETDRLVFKVVQGYGDGQQVRWIDPPTADGSEPEHPAPVLQLAGSAGTEPAGAQPAGAQPVGDDHHPAAGLGTAEGDGHAAAVATQQSVEPASQDTAGWWSLGISGAALLASAAAVLVAMRPPRRRPADPSP